MLKIAITGSIATGKSTALQIFSELGSYIISADEVVHNLLLNDKELIEELIKFLGHDIIDKNIINRDKIAKKVFDNPIKLKHLEEIIHPKVLKEIERTYDNVKNENYKFFICEMPLLFENNYQRFFDITVTITASESLAKKRYQKQDYEKRKQRQMPDDQKEKLCDFVISNNSTKQDFINKIKTLSINLSKKQYEEN